MPLSPGARLGVYEVTTLVGCGGMGVVYRARDARLDRQVAIEVLPPDMTRDDTAKRRFRQDTNTSWRQMNHPEIT